MAAYAGYDVELTAGVTVQESVDPAASPPIATIALLLSIPETVAVRVIVPSVLLVQLME